MARLDVKVSQILNNLLYLVIKEVIFDYEI